MKRFVFFVCLVVWGGRVFAQAGDEFFLPLTWEQASGMAVREGKLVMVEVGGAGDEVWQAVRRNGEVVEYVWRRVVAVRMDVDSPQGRAFVSRLLLAPLPTYAFFMPYGDLVGVVSPDEAGRRPERLREVLDEAMAMAAEKRRNSRTVEFEVGGLEKVLALAVEKKKGVFVYVGDEGRREALLMERDVFTLDRVADFYNSRFVNVRLEAGEVARWMERFGVGEVPAFLFLGGEGKVWLKAEGYCGAERLLALGKEALERAKEMEVADGQVREKEGMAGEERQGEGEDALVEEFVREGRFDEEGFKVYAKRLKKEKVEGWRQMVRETRMRVAERMGDWKTFIKLAEDRRREERVPDAELYRWAQKVEGRCQDGNVRYKMAQWLAHRVMEINRKEYQTGKVDLISYRGFFEKLADDLLKGVE